MAVTVTLYSHTPKRFGNKEVNLANLRVKLLANAATFTAAHTSIEQVDGGSKSTVTLTIASPGKVNLNGHGKTADTPVMLNTTGALPTGLTAGVTYYVRNPGANDFELSATPGGASINFTGTQSGVHSTFFSSATEISGNGWPAGGPVLANVTVTQAAITDATSNDAMLDADDVVRTAASGSIGPAYKAVIYDALTGFVFVFIDFGQAQSAGDTTDFKIRWHANGIINWTIT